MIALVFWGKLSIYPTISPAPRHCSNTTLNQAQTNPQHHLSIPVLGQSTSQHSHMSSKCLAELIMLLFCLKIFRWVSIKYPSI